MLRAMPPQIGHFDYKGAGKVRPHKKGFMPFTIVATILTSLFTIGLIIPFVGFPLWFKVVNAALIIIYLVLSLRKANEICTTDPGIIPKPFSYQVDPDKDYRVVYTDLD